MARECLCLLKPVEATAVGSLFFFFFVVLPQHLLMAMLNEAPPVRRVLSCRLRPSGSCRLVCCELFSISEIA